MFAFATALVLAGAPRRAAVGAYAIAVFTALGRIALGAHFPTDVLAGALVGILVPVLLTPILDRAMARVRARTEASPENQNGISRFASPTEV